MLGTLDRNNVDNDTLDRTPSFGTTTTTINLSDLPLIVDTVTKNVGKKPSDIVATVESILVQKNLVKPSETVTTTETTTKQTNKQVSDTDTTTESVNPHKN